MDMSEEEFLGIDRFVQQKALIHPVITAQNLCSIYQCPDQQMYRARVQFLFTLDQYSFDEQTRDALIDLVHAAILFSSDNEFSYPKAIVFLSIFMKVFRYAITDPYYLPKELYSRYEKLLLQHSVDRPPKSAQIFNLHDANLINEFFTDMIFRHLKLIVNSYTQKPILIFKTQYPVTAPVPRLPALRRMKIEAPQEQKEPEHEIDTPEIQTEQKVPNTVTVEVLRNRLRELHFEFVKEYERQESVLLSRIEYLESLVRRKSAQ